MQYVFAIDVCICIGCNACLATYLALPSKFTQFCLQTYSALSTPAFPLQAERAKAAATSTAAAARDSASAAAERARQVAAEQVSDEFFEPCFGRVLGMLSPAVVLSIPPQAGTPLLA